MSRTRIAWGEVKLSDGQEVEVVEFDDGLVRIRFDRSIFISEAWLPGPGAVSIGVYPTERVTALTRPNP